jgi:hypothetical protein
MPPLVPCWAPALSTQLNHNTNLTAQVHNGNGSHDNTDKECLSCCSRTSSVFGPSPRDHLHTRILRLSSRRTTSFQTVRSRKHWEVGWAGMVTVLLRKRQWSLPLLPRRGRRSGNKTGEQGQALQFYGNPACDPCKPAMWFGLGWRISLSGLELTMILSCISREKH